jgi:hypothetical protein
MTVFWISLTLRLSNKLEMRGRFQVPFELSKSEMTSLEEEWEPGMIGEGMKEGIDGIQGEFQMGVEEWR